MSPREHWKVHGPVQTLRSELAEWDINQQLWKSPQRSTVVQFRSDGGISEMEDHYSNGSISKSKFRYDDAGRLMESTFQLDDGPIGKTVYHYDESGRLLRKVTVDETGTEHDDEMYSYDSKGRKMKVQFVPKPPNTQACGTFYGVEGAEQAFGAENVAKITTHYDDHEQPTEALFEGEDGAIVLRVVLIRDGKGRVIKEESRSGEQPPFPVAQVLETAPPEERAAAEAVFAELFSPDKAMWSTTYGYDHAGRRIERETSMAGMIQSRTAWEYDDYDNPIREFEENTSGDLQADESGHLSTVNLKSFRHELRYEYKYDSQRNWTERVVSTRYETNPDFQRSNIERREISYY